jgi:hypothetical protein
MREIRQGEWIYADTTLAAAHSLRVGVGMNRRKLEKHLREHECELLRRGAKHDVWWRPDTEAMAPVPRHRTIKKPTVRAICRQLGIPLPDGF